nr:retrovirus-related Pol polyprotein from transposon TNT 1-94 [Tanacetum cinerariifolium]
MDKAKVVSSPLTPNFKLTDKDCPSSRKNIKKMDRVPYASAVSSLMYVMVCTRPDLAHVVGVGNPQMDLQEKGVIDSGCSRHMTENMSYLTDMKKLMEDMLPLEITSGEKITGKGNEMRKNVADLKKKAEEACTSPLGSSMPAEETSLPLNNALVIDVYQQMPTIRDHVITHTSKWKCDTAFDSSSAVTYSPDDQLHVQNKQHVNERVTCKDVCGEHSR